MKNNKGQIQLIIMLVGILFFVMLVGLLLVFGTMTIDWVFDEAVPELTELGTVGSANLSEYAGYTIAPLNSVVQNFTWLAGVIYVFALIGCLGLSVSFRFTGNRWLVGFFVVAMFLLIITSIFVSNIYEEFYNDGSEVAQRLHEQVLLSWLLLYSPLMMTVIGFICGIIMFTGEVNDGVPV